MQELRALIPRLSAIAMTLVVAPASLLAQHYTQTNLVSDQSGASVTDTNLVNPWGMSRSSGSPWWISDNGTGLSTLYDGSGNIQPLVVTVPAADPTSGASGTPTGTIFNGGTGFPIAPGKPALFLFATEDGTISGWNPGVKPTSAVIRVNQSKRSVFKGLTSATVNLPFTGPATFLYAADFRRGKVQIYDSNFHHVSDMEDRFRDELIPSGFAPFNVQNIGGNIYVAYAQQDSDKHDEVDGAGLGYVDIFSAQGRLLLRLEHGSWMNAPWGIALAPSDFGIFSHDVLVGQFGSGKILAFDPVTGRFKGVLRDANDKPLVNQGLWGLSFGNDSKSGNATTLYFTAGTNHEQDGTFGSITAVENTLGNSQ
jgi:uncharacterized protein (TIGR03118 family)